MAKFFRRAFLLVLLIIFALIIGFRFWQAERTPQGVTDLSFKSVALPFTHQADLIGSLPFLASAAMDIDGDGRDELFLGGGDDQADQFFKYKDGEFKPLSISLNKAESDASHGVANIDIDDDGDNDLFVARESGIWFHENLGGRQFGSQNLNLDLADNSTPLGIGFGDVNKDGLADMYVAGYIKIELVEGETNFSNNYGGFSSLFRNTGNNNWVDISNEAGIWRQHNTFLGVFADLDNDRNSDLIIAQDTGKVETYRGDGKANFTPINNPSDYAYPMGVAVGDYDNDGLVDLFFSNVGYTLPSALLKGNLTAEDVFNPDHMLFHNDGNLQFSDVSKDMGVARFGFAWGAIFADMNLDGREDILMAQNYARFPAQFLMTKYPGKIFQNYGEDGFKPVEIAANATNKNFGIAPIVSDFNGDGWPDLVWANLAGPSLAYINNGGDMNWIKVRLPNTAKSLNARVEVKTSEGKVLTKQFVTSQGLGSDQGRDMIFGLGAAKAETITISYIHGDVEVIESPAAGTVIFAGR